MGGPVVICAQGLGKRYAIGRRTERERYLALRDVVSRGARSLARSAVARGGVTRTPANEDFWALKDVDFEIRCGEVVGVIGRNGAGKSTLLKILSRITEPTEGQVTVRGRVASLLEVGTGFHPELTGRENIFLNGAILGMRRAEIRRKFDEIVAFAGVETFLDMPVKRYSTGMYVRLAFAVAAHLEPEILVVDEVLAVGDAEFQRKCLGKMGEVAGAGRTVLFVSHNMAAMAALAPRTIVLANGHVVGDRPTPQAIDQYNALGRSGSGSSYAAAPSLARPAIVAIRISPGEQGDVHLSGRRFTAEVWAHLPYPVESPCLSIELVNGAGVPVVHLWSYDRPLKGRRQGEFRVRFDVPRLALNVGEFTLKVYLSEPPGGEHFETLDGVCPFSVEVLDRTTLFGWRAGACTYLEDFTCETSVTPVASAEAA